MNASHGAHGGTKNLHENQIGQILLDRSIQLHRDLGPGLLESVYESILFDLLVEEGLSVTRQAPINFEYNGKLYENSFRADLIINNTVIVELKSIEKVNDVHKKQLLTYLKLSNIKLGYLLNFGEKLMKHGITRIINGTI